MTATVNKPTVYVFEAKSKDTNVKATITKEQIKEMVDEVRKFVRSDEKD